MSRFLSPLSPKEAKQLETIAKKAAATINPRIALSRTPREFARYVFDMALRYGAKYENIARAFARRYWNMIQDYFNRHKIIALLRASSPAWEQAYRKNPRWFYEFERELYMLVYNWVWRR